MCEISPRLRQGSLIKNNDERNKGRDTSMIRKMLHRHPLFHTPLYTPCIRKREEERRGKRKCACAGSTRPRVRFLCGCQEVYCHIMVSMYH